ncbi:MAG: hypothetical protein MUC50_18510 [Myxococcota bacterium]|nr:hypothetical protein [Myxococcota bacterium]
MTENLLIVVLAVLALLVVVLRIARGLWVGSRQWGSSEGSLFSPDPHLAGLLEQAKGAPKARVKDILREIGHAAATAGSPEKRAVCFDAAGRLALGELKRPGPAAGLFLRALRADPRCLSALYKLEEILMSQKRLRRMEATYWDVLGRLDDAAVGSDMWMRCWSGLASLYAESPRTVRRADAIRKAFATFASEPEASREPQPASVSADERT